MSKPKFRNKLIFNNYRVEKLIATTPLGFVYKGLNQKTNEPVALKFEKNNSNNNFLESEAYILYNLRGFGIPKIITFGKSGLYKVLIEEFLGLSIEKLWKSKKNINKYKLKNLCMIAIQILDRLEYIHLKNIIHRDIKPLNILIGRKDPKILYLIDFGLSRKYKSSRTGKHIKFKDIKKLFGSLRYISINGNIGKEQSRRDDLESLGYTLIELIKNHLPWSEIIHYNNFPLNKIEKCMKVYKLKLSISIEKLCEGLPEEFIKYIKYCRNLEFEEDPNYNYLRNLFTSILIKNEQINDLNFFWIINNKKINIEKKEKTCENNYNLLKRKNSSQNRLYNQIKISLGKAKSTEISNHLNLKHKNIYSDFQLVNKLECNLSISPKKLKFNDKNDFNTKIYKKKFVKKNISPNNKNNYINQEKNNQKNKDKYFEEGENKITLLNQEKKTNYGILKYNSFFNISNITPIKNELSEEFFLNKNKRITLKHNYNDNNNKSNYDLSSAFKIKNQLIESNSYRTLNERIKDRNNNINNYINKDKISFSNHYKFKKEKKIKKIKTNILNFNCDKNEKLFNKNYLINKNNLFNENNEYQDKINIINKSINNNFKSDNKEIHNYIFNNNFNNTIYNSNKNEKDLNTRNSYQFINQSNYLVNKNLIKHISYIRKRDSFQNKKFLSPPNINLYKNIFNRKYISNRDLISSNFNSDLKDMKYPSNTQENNNFYNIIKPIEVIRGNNDLLSQNNILNYSLNSNNINTLNLDLFSFNKNKINKNNNYHIIVLNQKKK